MPRRGSLWLRMDAGFDSLAEFAKGLAPPAAGDLPGMGSARVACLRAKGPTSYQPGALTQAGIESRLWRWSSDPENSNELLGTTHLTGKCKRRPAFCYWDAFFASFASFARDLSVSAPPRGRISRKGRNARKGAKNSRFRRMRASNSSRAAGAAGPECRQILHC